MLNRYFHRLLHYINLSFANYYLKDSTKQYIIPYICVVIDIHDYTLFIVTNIYSLINLFKDMNEKEMPDRETLKAENTKAQMRKGVLEMCILGIISGEELYTSDIINKLKENELVVVEGTVYPLLTRLKTAGYWIILGAKARPDLLENIIVLLRQETNFSLNYWKAGINW